MVKVVHRRSVAVGLVALAAAAIIAVACEGDTFGIDLRNDTMDDVLFEACVRECASIGRTDRVEPGESRHVSGTLDYLAWYRVRSEADEVLGCLRIDFDRREDVHELRVSQDLVPCP